MPRLRLSQPLALLALPVLVGCGGAAESRPVDGAVASPGPEAASPAGDVGPSDAGPARGGSADSFELTLAATPRAGTHRGTGSLGCMVHNGLWQATYEAPAQTGVSALQLQLKDVPAGGGRSDKVSLSAVFGSQVQPDAVTGMIDVHGAETGRDGWGTVTREGKGAVIRIEGTAVQGGRVTAVLRCATVDVLT